MTENTLPFDVCLHFRILKIVKEINSFYICRKRKNYDHLWAMTVIECVYGCRLNPYSYGSAVVVWLSLLHLWGALDFNACPSFQKEVSDSQMIQYFINAMQAVNLFFETWVTNWLDYWALLEPLLENLDQLNFEALLLWSCGETMPWEVASFNEW